MATLRGTEEQLLSVREAAATVTQAEAVLDSALATSDDPNNDPVVRNAKLRLAGAEAALRQLSEPLEKNDWWFRKIAKFTGLGFVAGIGLMALAIFVVESGSLFLVGLAVAFLAGVFFWANLNS